MVAIVSGNSLGLELTSFGVLGSRGFWGLPGQGNANEQVFVNASTGNLVVQRRDDFLSSRGLDNDALRTYNSLGSLNDDNGDNWSMGVYAQQLYLTGTRNAAGSTLTRTGRDGSQAVYVWDSGRNCYITRAGAGAHDTIVYNASGNVYQRTDGDSRVVEKYSADTGRLLSLTDPEGLTSSYTYDTATGRLTRVSDASGQTIWYDYSGTQLTAIRAEFRNSDGSTSVRSTVRYGYDASGRLSSVTVDLTPADGNVTDGNVYTTTYTYDGASKRIKTLTQSDGTSLSFTYVQVSGQFRVDTITDALGGVTRYAYDTVNRRTTVTDPTNQSWVYECNPDGQVVSITSPANNGASVVQRYAYDADGNVISITNGSGETVTMAYDANGNQIRVIDQLGNTVTRTYSQLTNALLTETVSNLSTPAMVNYGGLSFDGTALVKTGGSDGVWGDAAFRTNDGLIGGASITFVPSQENKSLMVGLTTDPGISHGYGDIDFALYCRDDGKLFAFENGQSTDLGATYAAGDSLRVTYSAGKVVYVKNGVVLRTVTVTVSDKLYVDSAFRDRGARVDGLAFGAAPSTGGVPLVAESNATVGMGGVVTKTAGAHGVWDASVRSLGGFTGGAMVSFKPGQTDKSFMVGLNRDPAASDSYASIDYALYCTSDGRLYAYESGVSVSLGSPTPTYAATDTLKVVYTGSAVQYIRVAADSSSTVLREVAVTISEPLYLDSSMASAGAKITDLKFGRTGLTTVMAAGLESGMSLQGDTLTKVGGTSGAWDSSMRSSVGYAGGANLSFQAGQNNKAVMAGLTTRPDQSASWGAIDYAFYLAADGYLEIREGGGLNVHSSRIAYSVNDRLQVTYDGSYIKYLINGTTVRSVQVSITEPLYADTSFYHVGASITALRFGDRAGDEFTTRYVYADNDPTQLRFVVTPQGRVTEYRYDSYGQRTSQIVYPQHAYAVTALAADASLSESQMATWLATITDRSSTVRTDFVYDARGLLTTKKDYLSTAVDGSGSTPRSTQYVYDPSGRLLQTILPGNSTGDEAGLPTVFYTYDGLGRVLTVTDERGGLTSTVYQDALQKMTVTYASGGVATSLYDKAGRLISVTRGALGATAYAYDAAGRLLMTTDATGVRNFRLYDTLGRQVASIDADGSLTETVYDGAGRVFKVIKYATAVSLDLIYDSVTGLPLSPTVASIRPATVAADVQSWNIYDEAGRLVYEVVDNGAVVQHDYDGTNRRVRTTRYATAINVSSLSLEAVRSRLAAPRTDAEVALDRSERFMYDADGLLIATIDAEGYLVRFTYDQAGRKVQSRRFATAVAEAKWAGGGTLAGITPATSGADQVDVWYYDGRGLLKGHVDSRGYITRYGYNARGLQSEQIRYAQALGRTPSWNEDFDTVLAEIRPNGAWALEPDDRITYSRYTLDGKLLSTTNHEGTKTAYEYDAGGRLVKTTVGQGRSDARVTESSFDAWGRLVSTTLTDGGVVESTYDGADRLTSTRDASGNKTLYFYDVDGRLRYTVNALGDVSATEYNALGQRTAHIVYGTRISTTGLAGGLVNSTLTSRVAAIQDDAKDSRIRYAYNGVGQLSSVTDAIGAINYLYYNLFGQLRKQEVAWQAGTSLNLSRRVETFSYDRRGLMLSVVKDEGGISSQTSSAYDAFGRAIQSTDARGKVTTTTYDRLGRVIQVKDPLLDSVYTDYDAFGQVLSVTDQAGKVTTYAYDRAARKVTMTTAEGVVVTTTSTVYGQIYSIRDGNGVTTSYTYDQAGRLTERKVGSAVVEDNDYDVAGRLLVHTDARGTRTTYTYDAANRVLTRTVDPTDADADLELNLVTKWEFDAKGQAWKVTDPRGIVTEYTFDLAGRKIRQVVDPVDADSGVELNLETTWSYDAEGRVATVTDPGGTTTVYTYDTLGRRLKEQVDPTGLNLTRSYTYDAAGNVLTSTDARNFVTRYEYDDNGRVLFMADPTGAVTGYQYNARGQVAKVTRYSNGVTAGTAPGAVVANASADQVTRYEYDNDGRLAYTIDALGGVTRQQYDANGNVNRITQYYDRVSASELGSAAVATPALDRVTVIEYDAFNRETWRADAMGGVTRLEYDAGGSLLQRTRYYNSVPAGTSPSAVVTSSSDRVERFVHDAAGRQTYRSDAAGAVTRTQYDRNGNVTQVKRFATLVPNASPDSVVDDAADRVVSYFYDAAGRRTYEVDELGYVTQNVYDEDGHVVTNRRYADLPDSRSQPATAVANDALDRVTRYEYDAAGRLTKTTDALGQSESYTYDKAGNRASFTNKRGFVWTYTYDALGRLLSETTPSVPVYRNVVNADGTLELDLVSSSLAVVTRMVYDRFGNLVSRTEAEGQDTQRETTYAYDKLNRQVKVTYPPIGVHAENTTEVGANTRVGEDVRDEIVKSVFTQTFYDVFGDAVSSVDRRGFASFKTYDAAGRVRYEVDALGYITQYNRNAFGEVTSQRRYATASSLAGVTPTSSAPGLSLVQIDGVVGADGFVNALDRVLQTGYDKAGRVISVTEPSVFNFQSSFTPQGEYRNLSAGKRTETLYNAFGEVVRVGTLADVTDSGDVYFYTLHYYDVGGRRTATIDPAGYTTTYGYDSQGNLTRQTEYYSKSLGPNTVDSFVLPGVHDNDRTTTWTWDKLNRKLTETRKGVTYHTVSGNNAPTPVTGDVTTSYGYDALGNQIWVKDALGGYTRTYYDALGRTRAVIAPSRNDINGAALLPLVEFRRDALGNVICKFDRATTASDVTETGYVAVSSGQDRATKTLFDSWGNAVKVQDAGNVLHYYSYSADGKLAKTWQSVTDHDGAVKTLFTSNYFDALGRVTRTFSPSAVDGQVVSTDYRYNSFGEVTGCTKNQDWADGKYEYFEYDKAGRLWKTNTGDGTATVYLYDLLGRQTAEISSAGSGRSGAADVATATNASTVASWTSTRRTNIIYDRSGYVLRREEPERLTVEGGVTLREAVANASIASSRVGTLYGAGGEDGQTYQWSGTNRVSLSWTTLQYLGGGDVKVELRYRTAPVVDGGSTVEKVETQIFQSHEANSGVSLEWSGTSVDEYTGFGGISSIAQLVVYKKDVNGNWQKVIDRKPSEGRPFGSAGSQLEIGSPVDPTTVVTFKYRVAGSGSAWQTVTGLTKFGDSHWFNISALSGTYEYQVLFAEKDTPADVTETGTFTTGVTDTDDQAKTNKWLRPIIEFTRDRWGNALTQSDPRNQTWLTRFTYDWNNQVTSEKRPDPVNGDSTANSPLRTIYYDKLGRQIAIKDERGFINSQQWDAGGNLVKETHADGGVVTYFYDAFGQRVRMVDAIGNTTSDRNSELYKTHTTSYAFDGLGRLIRTRHGNTSQGSVWDREVGSDFVLSPGVKKDLLELFTYDEAGRKISQTNGNDETIKYWYDRAGNLVKTRLNGGQTSTAAFDALNHKLSETDANGNTATWQYDYFGVLRGHTDIGGKSYDYLYDAAGQLTNQTNQRGQQLVYGYDAAGQLIRISDLSGNATSVTTQSYDLAGRHLREKVVRNGQVLQDNHLSYDTLGRLVDSADNRVHMTFTYDAAGNRTKVFSHVLVAAIGDPDVETLKDATRYFVYDSMNRQTTVDGVLDSSGNVVIDQTQGHQLTYDLNGNRTSDRFWGRKVTSSQTTYSYIDELNGEVTYTGPMVYDASYGYTTETYQYDALDRLSLVDRDGTVVDQRWYDGAGRVVQSGPVNLPTAYATKLNENTPADEQIGMELRKMRYDASGRLLIQRAYKSDGKTLKYDVDYQTYTKTFTEPGGFTETTTYRGYDDAGNVLNYRFKNYEGDSYTNTTSVTLEKFEGYVESVTRTTSTKFQTGTVVSTYDANGFLVNVDDQTENTLDKAIVNDAAGRVLRVVQNGNSLWTHIVNGQIMGKHGVGPNEIDPRTSKNQAKFQQTAEFEFGYRGISGSYPAPSIGSYTVRQGDSLQGIAQTAWGDSSQWWRIAEANGVQNDRDLRVGQTLTLPSAISGTSNNTGTYKPYNPSDVVGDTSPNLPQPKNKSGCGGLAQIVMIVVAVVVTIYTAGAAAGWLASAAPSMFATSAAVSTAAAGAASGTMAGMVAASAAAAGSTAGIVAGAIGAAAGSIVSQLAGVAMGAAKFSWKQVAQSSISGAVSAGVNVTPFSTTETLGAVGNAFVRSAISNAATQGASIAVGLQRNFSWTGVAAAAVGSAVGAGATAAYAGPISDAIQDRGLSALATRSVAGFASGVAASAMRGGRVSIVQVAADAFGNALGSSLADQMSEVGVPPPASADEKAAILSMFEGGPGGDSTPSRDWFAGSSLRLGESGRGPRLGTGSIEPDPTPDELQAAFRQSERDYRSATERSVAGSGYVARNGDSISRIVGSSDPQAIGNFMRANGLSSSNVEAGRNYFRPDEVAAYGDSVALGQAVLNNDNARLAALAQERFAFSDGRDARDIRESFAYQSRMSRELGDLQAQADYQAKLASGPSVSAWDRRSGTPSATAPAHPFYNSFQYQAAMGVQDAVGVIALPELAAAKTMSVLGGLALRADRLLGVGNVGMAEVGAVERLLYGARVGEGLPGTSGVTIPGRPTPAQLESLTVKHDVEFAVTYKLGPNEAGGGGQYFLHSGSRGSVRIPLEADRMVIYHTHPGGTAYASQADMDMLKLFQQVGSPQRSSQIVPVGKDVVRFGTDYTKR